MKYFFRRIIISIKRWFKIKKIYQIKMELHGGEEYGGWSIHPNNLSKESVVYSFGVGKDISFDLSLIHSFGLSIYAFDPTPQSIVWIENQVLPSQFQFFPFGIGIIDGISKFYPPKNPEYVSHAINHRKGLNKKYINVEMKQFISILKKLGHKRIDILKMDIEGSEYLILDDIIGVTKDIKISQILIEFHHFLDGFNLSQTNISINKLSNHGYVVSHISDNQREYSFILEEEIFND